MIVLDVGDHERAQGYETAWGKLRAGMEASDTTSEICVEVTRRCWWEIWIYSDCLRDLAGLKDKSAQFFSGAT